MVELGIHEVLTGIADERRGFRKFDDWPVGIPYSESFDDCHANYDDTAATWQVFGDGKAGDSTSFDDCHGGVANWCHCCDLTSFFLKRREEKEWKEKKGTIGKGW